MIIDLEETGLEDKWFKKKKSVKNYMDKPLRMGKYYENIYIHVSNSLSLAASLQGKWVHVKSVIDGRDGGNAWVQNLGFLLPNLT